MLQRFEFRPANCRRDELRRPEYFQAADRRGPNRDWRWKPEQRWRQNWRQSRRHLGLQQEFHSRDYKINRIGAAFHRQLNVPRRPSPQRASGGRILGSGGIFLIAGRGVIDKMRVPPAIGERYG